MKSYAPVIPKAELEHGAYYQGTCRNATVARWDASKQRFYHHRTKFGQTFVESICAPEDDSQFDVFIAEVKINPPETTIPLEEP